MGTVVFVLSESQNNVTFRFFGGNMSSISTIKDVAARAGVAPSTVSKYINGGSVREKNVIAIREAIAELEFRANPFARNLKSQRSHAIGQPDVGR